MEKRLLLAAALSFAVLFVWHTVVAPPPKTQIPPTDQQHIENKEVIEESTQKDSSAHPLNFVEEKHIWKTDRFELEFTNKGGNLSQVILAPDQLLPVNNFFSISSLDNKEFTLKENSQSALVYVYEENEIYLRKEYKINNDNGLLTINVSGNGLFNQNEFRAYDLDMSILEQHKSQKEIISKGEQYKRDHDSRFEMEKPLYEYAVNSGNKIFRRAKAFQFVSEKNDATISGSNEWVAFRNRYYCAIVRPDFEVNTTSIKTIDKENLSIYWDVSREMSKNNFNLSAMVYLGPEDKNTLKSFGFGFEKIKLFYSWAIFEWPAKFIHYVLHGIHKIIPVWGLCIILISLAVYLATYPLTLKSMTSMRKMQQIQPEITALREKHKDNPQQMNAEMMAIYHRYNINPVGGCLPMLLQMPIFIGLYQVLWRDVAFKGQNFLWIKDLSEPDRLLVFSWSLPFFGNELNILPLFMVVIMFAQQWLNLKSTVVTDPAQIMQQRMMMYLMPVILGFIFYKFSSGLTLYFVVFYLMSTLTQWKFSQVNGKKP